MVLRIFSSRSLRTAVVQVGVMDIDICGPSIPKVMGLEGEQVRPSSPLSLTHARVNPRSSMSASSLIPGPRAATVTQYCRSCSSAANVLGVYASLERQQSPQQPCAVRLSLVQPWLDAWTGSGRSL